MDPDARIDPQAPLTPYRQLAAILRARIDRGDWSPGRPIPSEQRLADEYGIARTTVRRGIQVLVDEDMLFVVPHRGMYVSDKTSSS